MKQHLVFYDGACGLCDRAVSFLLKWDKEKLFVFAPLQGETAKTHLQKQHFEEDSMVLLEDYKSSDSKLHLMGKAAFRSLWLLGGVWKLIAWPYFLPKFFINPPYRLIANNRRRLFKQCSVATKNHQDRFLP